MDASASVEPPLSLTSWQIHSKILLGREGQMSTTQLPLLPLRDLIIFPHMMMPLFVGREKSINALEDAMSKQTDIVLAAQKDAKTNNPEAKDIYSVGTVGTI